MENNNANKKNQIMTTYAEKLHFCENYVKNNAKGRELAKELARDYELNDQKTGQYSLANWLSEYERNKYIDLEANPIKIDYVGLGEQEAKNIVKSYVMDKEYNISNLDKDIEKNIQEIQKQQKDFTLKNDKDFKEEIDYMKKIENFGDFYNKAPDIRRMEYYENQTKNEELKKEFKGVWNSSALYTDIQKNQHKFQYYTEDGKKDFINKIIELKKLKDYMPKEAIEKMQETTKAIEKQLSNGITR